LNSQINIAGVGQAIYLPMNGLSSNVVLEQRLRCYQLKILVHFGFIARIGWIILSEQVNNGHLYILYCMDGQGAH
jgi:hypothetical protein